jgi:hypothetical protein
MSRGAHAAPKTRGAVTTAARAALVRTGAFGGALVLAWSAVSAASGQGYLDAFAAESESGASQIAQADPQMRKVDALNRKYDCSLDGLADGVIPARTVVRVDGEVRLATFDEGWAIHLGDVPGSLVSVCAR